LLNLLSSSASCCNDSTIQAHAQFNQPFSMYSVIVGYPSSKKSVLMSLAKDSFNKMYAELHKEQKMSKDIILMTNNSKNLFILNLNCLLKIFLH